MPLNLDAKKKIVADFRAIVEKATSAVIADYRGLTVSELNEFRVKARAMGGVYVQIVRNTLVKRAVEGTEFSCLQDACVGPSVFVFSQEDPGAGARLCKEFGKNRDKFSVKALSVGGQLYSANDLDAIASLPTRDQSLSMLLSVMKAPVAQFVRTLAEPCAKFVRTVAAVGDQKSAA